jgi:uncharacterized protein YndB with AHSA1/START domain
MTEKTKIKRDLEDKSITVSREFKAPLELVWRAYTEKEFLNQWWGPAPWKAETKSMDFREGGFWLYAMAGPENQKHWARMNYLKISNHKKFEIQNFFCEENGNVDGKLPASQGEVVFAKTQTGTHVDFKLKFSTEEALKQTVEMGFEQGISQCTDQLEVLLSKLKQ